jgi:hypothetical protein
MEEIVYSNIQVKDCGTCAYDYDFAVEEWTLFSDDCTSGCSCGPLNPGASLCTAQIVGCV